MLLSLRSLLVLSLGLLVFATWRNGAGGQTKPDSQTEFDKSIRPLLQKHCLECHSSKVKKGSLDLERFAKLDDIRKDVKPWQGMIEQIEAGEMPPKDKPQPTDAQKKHLLGWVRGFLDSEARARSGDPGHVPLRRLSNAEYDATIRDLTGVDLRPAREFPVDGAAGEGFTNAAESLSDISPALLSKYLNAAKEMAAHAVLLPEGFRFSPKTTRRDWTDESTASLREFYSGFVSGDGRLAFTPYLLATVRHRDALKSGQFAAVAQKEKLNEKYLRILFDALSQKTSSSPLREISERWQNVREADVPQIANEITALQASLWKTVKVGNYVRESWGQTSSTGYQESLTRQVPTDPAAAERVTLRFAAKPTAGQTAQSILLASKDLHGKGPVVWERPRFEGNGPPLFLKDYSDFGPRFEIDFATAFASTAKYLDAAVELANDKARTVDQAAKDRGIDADFLRRWVALLDVPARNSAPGPRRTQAVPLTRLEDPTPPNPQWPSIRGWRKRGTDLPAVVSNSSAATLNIPGRVAAHGVAMHPLPLEFVAVSWKSPIQGDVKIVARIAHAHPACGNGVAWWIDHRRSGRSLLLGQGNIDLGKEARLPSTPQSVEIGDELVLAVDARDRNHSCDMTEVALRITDTKSGRVWDLAADVADTIEAGNPHADKFGNAGVWSFGRGDSSKTARQESLIPMSSVLGEWLTAASNPAKTSDLPKLAEQVQKLLSGPRPEEYSFDQKLYDQLVIVSNPLFLGTDARKYSANAKKHEFGLPKERFDASGNIVSDTDVSITVPAALMIGRELVVDVKLPAKSESRALRVKAGTAATPWSDTILASPKGSGYRQLLAGHDAFRRIFPLYVCFPNVVPSDEVVTLKMFHREDEPLERLFLNADQKAIADRLWREQRFISRQPQAEFDYLPQFMGYTTQDTPKDFQQFFIDRKPLFQKHADEYRAEVEAAVPAQIESLLTFAGKAYRRPLTTKESAELRDLYQRLRGKGVSHDEAFRGVLARILVAPAFLFRIEQSPPGKEPAPVNDWELATRLSYFLWSSQPDAELRQLAQEGRLRDPKVLEKQVQRMLHDPRLRSLAIEFGTQSIHVRGFDDLKEKNEKLFPTFDAKLRQAIYEESIRFFQDLFENDRPILNILNADYTFLNESLAQHYGIPGVKGPEWRRVENVRRYGRGGILGMASVQAKQSGASRTSPILRGNWVVETLLGEKLPKPPPNVPQLPEEEGADKLTVRQLVERHTKDPNCASCHVRIDQFGFSLEQYDAIGRRREKDLGGLVIDAKSRLRDGTEFTGVDGLRNYLMTQKQDLITRLFCRRLLGYALGRSTTLSDTVLLDQMEAAVKKADGRISAALLTIVHSPQFRMIRGADFSE